MEVRQAKTEEKKKERKKEQREVMLERGEVRRAEENRRTGRNIETKGRKSEK